MLMDLGESIKKRVHYVSAAFTRLYMMRNISQFGDSQRANEELLL